MKKDELSNVSNIKYFYDYFGTIYGQIQLRFNHQIEGIVDRELNCISELLVPWFMGLNKVLLNLESNEYVALILPDSDSIWLEFINQGETLNVTKVKGVIKKILFDLVVTKPIKKENIFWRETQIDKAVFYNEIVKATKRFLNNIYLINPILVKTSDIKELNKLYKIVLRKNYDNGV